jgi:acyl-CoA synthetase (AMP-forming)/AMP-acid ligase II
MPSSLTFRSTLTEVIADHASAFPERPAVIFPDADADPVLSYATIAGRGWAMAEWLRAELAPGSRVMLTLPTGPEFVTAFFGCVAAGMVAVPTPIPDNRKSARRRNATVVRDSGSAMVLATGADLPGVVEWAQSSALDVRCATVPADLGVRGELPAGLPRQDDDSLVFLQYTSGSTGDPKGVMVNHANLLHNTALYARGTGATPDTRFGGWIPLFHDMGLVAQFCTPLALGATTVLAAPSTFLRQPLNWLRMIDDYGIANSAAPNFAYERCTRLISDADASTVDLSRWDIAINGSEPIHAPTMAAFSAKFAAAGFRAGTMTPGYGMAEATVYVSSKPTADRARVLSVDRELAEAGVLRPTPDGSREVVSCGVAAEYDVRIVDPATRDVRADGDVGEIWLRGPSVAQGYWGRTEATETTFHASTTGGEQGFLRTGDLGTLHEGELYVTGRLKEMLIVHGRNIFPQDLEQEARATDAAMTGLVGAAFGVCAPDERVVIVHEVANPKVDLRAICLAIKDQLTRGIGVPIGSVVLVRRGMVRRTTSGKIERGATRDLFLRGELPILHADLEPAVARLLRQQAVTAG